MEQYIDVTIVSIQYSSTYRVLLRKRRKMYLWRILRLSALQNVVDYLLRFNSLLDCFTASPLAIRPHLSRVVNDYRLTLLAFIRDYADKQLSN